MTALITHTDFVFLPITSFERAEAFYTGVLGLPLSKRYRGGIGGELETGNLTILLLDTAKIGREFAPSKGAIALRVDDVEAARATLEEPRRPSSRARSSTAASATRRSSRIPTATC